MQPKRVLVALAGTSADPDMLRLVASIAKPAKAEVIGIHVIEVRWNLPLDAVLEQLIPPLSVPFQLRQGGE